MCMAYVWHVYGMCMACAQVRVLRLDPPIAQQDLLAGKKSDTGNLQLGLKQQYVRR